MDTQALVRPGATAVQTPKENSVEFIPLGATEAIRLSASMVRNFVAVPTRSGALPSERDCIRFIMLCKGKRANPFEGDCYLIGYDGEKGPQFSMVCSIDLFLKRAEDSADYDGIESGIIVVANEGPQTPVHKEGCFFMPGEKVVGGWAKAFRKNRARPDVKIELLGL